MSDAGNLFTDGNAYERMMGHWSRLAGAAFLDWLDVPKHLRWLDVGCGNGAFTEELIARCAPAAVTAIDPSDAQLAYARTRPGAAMAEFQLGDAQRLPFGDDSFDAAAMALVISFLPDPDKAAAEMARVVRPGGWVATYMWDFPSRGVPVQPIYEALESMGLARGHAINAAVSEPEVLRGVWQKAGLRSVETRTIRIATAYSGFDDFWDSNTVPIGPQGKVIAGLSASAKDELRARLRDRLPVAADGRIVRDAVANAVKGRVAR